MYLIHLFIIVSTIMCASSEMSDIEEMYLNFFVQIESVQKSIDILKLRVDAMSETSKNKQPYVDKETFDDLKAQVDAWKDNFKAKQQNGDSKMENSESQQSK
ncbi:uncharacterized protein LOC135950137 [Calliphora vicina]|uniref:uncharacterized protein LOC135950137 n=1 Tax=Calliphora vicina TaxID=7373 RepID=UPI00325C0D72